MKLKGKQLLLVIIILVGFLVRVWGINFGLPNLHHFDERLVVYTAFFAASNKLQPDMFLHPMLLSCVLIFLYGIYFLFGLIFGFWNSTQEFFIAYLADPTIFLLLGRLFTVFIGVFSVWLTYWIGKKIYQEEIGLIAAFFLSSMFLHIQESHYIKEGVLVGFLGLLAFYFNFLVIKKNKLRDYLFSGILLGLLAAVKYHFFVFLPMFILAHFLKAEKKFSLKIFWERKFWLAIVVMIIVFFSFNPYILLLPKQALKEIAYQAEISTIQWAGSEGQPIWLYYLAYHLRYGLGWPLLILTIGGIFYLLVKSRKAQDFLLASAPLSFFATIMIFGGTNFARYAVMILPFLALAAAILVSKLITFPGFSERKADIFLTLICILVISPSFFRIIKFDYCLTRPDTRALAKEWVEKNIPPGTKIVNEGAIRSQYPSIYGPALWMDSYSISKELEEVKKVGLPGTYLTALLEASKGKIGYNLRGTVRLDKEYDPVSEEHFSLSGVEKYLVGEYQYLICSSWTKHDHEDYAIEFKKSLEENYQVVREFIPYPKLGEDPTWKVDFAELDKVNIFRKDLIFGPVIRIYKLIPKSIP